MIELNTIHNLDAITFLEQVYEDYGDKSIHIDKFKYEWIFDIRFGKGKARKRNVFKKKGMVK